MGNAGDGSGVIQSFLQNSGTGLASLMDQQQSVYRSYEPSSFAHAPFPVQVVVDRQGVIRYLRYQYDAEGVRQVIDRILAE